MNTETRERIKGWVGYDADCAICRGWAARTHDLLARHGLHLVPLQSPWLSSRPGLDGQPLTEMKLLEASGDVSGGADACIRIARSIWWAWSFYVFAQIPGVKTILRSVYRAIARNRHCLGSHCRVEERAGRTRRHITTAFYDIP